MCVMSFCGTFWKFPMENLHEKQNMKNVCNRLMIKIPQYLKKFLVGSISFMCNM